MIEKFFILMLMIGSAHSATNLIINGDFQSCREIMCYYSGGWYNQLNINYPFYVGYDTNLNLVLKIMPFYSDVCQIVSFPFKGYFNISFMSKNVFNNETQPYLNFTLDRQSLVGKYVSNSEYEMDEALIFLDIGIHEICFHFVGDNGTIYIEDVMLLVEEFYEHVTYEVREDASNFNSIIVSLAFDDYFFLRYWNNQNLEDRVTIEIDGIKINQTSITQIYNEQIIQFRVNISDFLTENSLFSLEVANDSIEITEIPVIYFETQRRGNLPYVIYYSDEQIQALENVNTISGIAGKSVGTTSNGWSFIGVTYLITNLFAFSNVIVLYNYLDFKWHLTPYKKIVNSILKFFVSADINVLLDSFFGFKINVEVGEQYYEKLDPSSTELEGMLEHGFSTIFIKNSWDQLFNIGLMLAKLTFVRFLCYCPLRLIRKNSKEMMKKVKIFILYEILAGSATIILPCAYVFGISGKMGSFNIQSKFNMAVFVVYSSFLFLTPFLLLHYEFSYERQKQKQLLNKKKKKKKLQQPFHQLKNNQEVSQNELLNESLRNQYQGKGSKKKIQKENKGQKQEQLDEIQVINLSSSKQKKVKVLLSDQIQLLNKKQKGSSLKSLKIIPKQRRCLLNFFENLLLYFIPLLIGIGNLDLFIAVSLSFMVFRMVVFLKNAELYEKWQYFKEIFNKIIWLTFNLNYLAFWLLEKIQIADPTEKYFVNLIKGLGLSSVLLIIAGLIGQSLFLVIGLMNWIVKKIKLCINQRNKVHPAKPKEAQVPEIKESKKQEKKKEQVQKNKQLLKTEKQIKKEEIKEKPEQKKQIIKKKQPKKVTFDVQIDDIVEVKQEKQERKKKISRFRKQMSFVEKPINQKQDAGKEKQKTMKNIFDDK